MIIHRNRTAGIVKMFKAAGGTIIECAPPEATIREGIERKEKSALLKARRIERSRPMRRQRHER
jgi:hypothetical protein